MSGAERVAWVDQIVFCARRDRRDVPSCYGDIVGRWPSPDPAGLAAANPLNPQSWNRYAYVMKNPRGDC